MGKQWKPCQTLFFEAPKSLQMVIAAMKLNLIKKKKRLLLLVRKVMTNLILKSRDITLPTVHLVKTVVFPVVRYGCESWTIKKAES